MLTAGWAHPAAGAGAAECAQQRAVFGVAGAGLREVMAFCQAGTAALWSPGAPHWSWRALLLIVPAPELLTPAYE